MAEMEGAEQRIGGLKAKLLAKRTVILVSVLGFGFAIVVLYGIKWWIQAMNTVSTDDAHVTASYAAISPEVAGKIVHFPAEEGDLVQKGSLLVRIESEDYRTALNESLAELNRAMAQYEEGQIKHKAMEAMIRGEISRAEAAVEAARGMLKEKERLVELAKLVAKSQIDQVAASLKVAESNLGASEVELKNASLELERSRKLFEKQFISAKDLDNAIAAYDRAKATVEMRQNEVKWAKADLELARVSKLNDFRDDARLAETRATMAKSDLKKAEADLRLAKARLADLDAFRARLESQASTIEQLRLKVETRRRQLENTEIKSPVNGIVVRRSADIGDIVQAGQPLLKVIIEDTLEVRANIRETYLRYIERGNPVEIYVDAYPHRVFQGKVKIIGDATDSEFALFRPTGPFTKLEQVIPVAISLDGHSNNRDLKPGMNVVVYIQRSEQPGAEDATPSPALAKDRPQ